MEGYGITAIDQNSILKFKVKILGILHNALVKQDLIIVKCYHPVLEKTGIIAGMSGSPVYIKDRLIGAIAYGWSFSKEPIAGVTPIKDMLKLLSFGKLRFNQASPLYKLYYTPLPINDTVLKPIETPLMISGVDSIVRRFISKKLERFGIRVLEVPSGRGGVRKKGRVKFKPGDGIGIQLIKGDINATAIGTVTSVNGSKILAFGHPMFNIGRVKLPATTTDIITIISRWNRSFKLGEPVEEAGSLILDKQSAILVDTKEKAEMVPVQLSLFVKDRKIKKRYFIEVAYHRVLTPLLVEASLLELLSEGVNDLREVTLTIKSKYSIVSKSFKGDVVLEDILYNRYGVNDPFAFLTTPSIQALSLLLDNEFEKVKLNKIKYIVEVEWKDRHAEIIGVRFDKSKVRIGDSLTIIVYLRGDEGNIFTIKKEIEIPSYFRGEEKLSIEVAGGEDATLFLAPPQSLKEMILNWRKRFLANQLVITIKTKGYGVALNGKVVKNIPAFAMYGIVDEKEKSEIKTIGNFYRYIIDTGYVIEGKTSLDIEVIDNINYP